jgi:hypothetical protein
MLRCPFCDADLGGGSNRLRGGRCPKCSSILSWGDDESQPEAGPTNLPSLRATLASAGSTDEDDAMPMKDIVRTIIQRAAPSPPSLPQPNAPRSDQPRPRRPS